ncbi:MAG: hypothetical protein ACR2NZ_10315 [Rubripirellula sp.]
MKKFMTCLAICLVAGATVVAGDVELKNVKCVVADKPASEGKSADYKGGKVYFCCGGCAGKFAADAKKYAERANHQLVATKQYEQKGCPFSGGEVNPETLVSIGGTKVGFCCNGCKGKVESVEDDAAKMKLVFADKAFKKAFQKKGDDEG